MDSTTQNTGNEDGFKKGPFDDLDRDELIKKCKSLLTLAQKAKQAKAELQNEVKSYKIQFEKCETEKKASQDTVHTLNELVNTLTEQKLNYITELDAAQNKVKTLTGKCALQENEVAKCNAILSRKEEKIAEVLLQLSNIDSEVISLKRQNNRLTEENEQLINQLTEMETRIEEFNQIGLQQREQLRILEEQVTAGTAPVQDGGSARLIEELNNKIKELESELQKKVSAAFEQQKQIANLESKIKEVSQLFESEKDKKEKLNVKLRSYKDKILKCAACINQLKNTRFILLKLVEEYSESIPKWQNDIIKASKFLDTQLNELNNENHALKFKLQELEKRILEFTTPPHYQGAENAEIQIGHLNSEKQLLLDQLLETQSQVKLLLTRNDELDSQVADLKPKYDNLFNNQLPTLVYENGTLKDQLNELTQKVSEMFATNSDLNKVVQDVEKKNNILNDSLQALKHKKQGEDKSQTVKNLNLQIRALESEKATLVKEKLNAKDSLVEVDNQNRTLLEQVSKLQSDLDAISAQYAALNRQKEELEMDIATGSHSEISNLKREKQALQECYDLLKKEHENLNDLNGLLKDEVETLKMSLEQPNDGADHLSDLNVSLQADIVKLETKLSAYKQENASLLAEVKESRAKIKEVESIKADYEDTKTKLVSYKTENTELLNEMKEINQVLKERGEAISKLQKAIAEMERLIETLEKDRDDLKKEKDDLVKEVNTLTNELKNAEQATSSVNAEAEQQLSTMRTKAFTLAAEKEAIIASLKEEIEKLKESQHHSSGELPNDDNMSTSTLSKADENSRMKDLDESFEDKYSKLRMFALKLKKKLNETNIQLQNTEQDKMRLEKMLASNKPAATQDVVDGPERSLDKEVIANVVELEDKVKNLTDALEATKINTTEFDTIKAELAAKIEQLSAEVQAHKATKDSLEKARRDVKKRSVLSLEMEDYERSMKELTTKMEENKKKVVQMESTIDTQEGTITAMKIQIKLLEEQIKIEETQNRLVKEELHHASEEAREKENFNQVKNGIISKLEQDLEEERRKSEEANIEMTALLGDKEKRIVSLGEEKMELNNKLKRVEFKCADLEEKLRITNIELEDLKTDYTSYKVRAQSVLRQNQTVDHSQEEQLKEEAAALKAQLDSVSLKLTSSQEKCAELQAAAELERRRASEAAAEAARAAQRSARLQADLARLASQLDSEGSQHKLQLSTLTHCYKTQITELEAKLQRDTEELKKQLVAAAQATGGGGSAALDRADRNDQYSLPVIPKEDSDGEMDINVSMLPREEGEGSEAAPSPPLSKSFLTGGAGGRSPVSLERLLEEGVPEDEALDASSLALTPEQELADLRRKMQAQLQRVKHVTVLLSESERECARYAQMNELLKAEVRRARGSLERTEHAHNAEYMKNVTLKFVTLPPGDERSRLVPVLQKILTLTSDETQKINAVARGADPNPGKSWGSYLPWPGGK